MSRANFYHKAGVVRVIPQREDGDCAVACLAMLTGSTYEDALRVVCGVDDEGASDGLYIAQLLVAAEELGSTLRRKRRFDLSKDTGILYLVHKKKDEDRHVVILRQGVIIDTNNNVWFDPDKYLKFYSYKPTMLLEEFEEE